VARSELTSPPATARWELRHDPQPADLHDHLLQVCLLLLLRETPAAHGEVRERLRPLGFEETVGDVERALEGLAAEGLAAPPDGTGAHAVYMLTALGDETLTRATADLRCTKAVLGGFLARCSERLVAGP